MEQNPNGVNITVQDLLRQDAKIQDVYFNISGMKLSITSLYLISDAPKIIWTENSDVINSMRYSSTNPGSLCPGAKDPGP